jgi:beta-galactosidase
MKSILSIIFLTATFLFPVIGQTAQMGMTTTDMSTYLLTYFKDDTHGLYFALSDDGYTFTDINDGKPVISGDTIAQQKGIRDPHITRGKDGAFYLAMTDLHVFGKEAGYRTTQWERDEKYGWGNNRGFVLMKSFDLIHWTRSNVIIEDLFPNLDVACAWAPQTIYDPEEDKMMLYFTMRIGGKGKTKLYYAYTDNDFTTLITRPQLLFNYPDSTVQILDADITPLPDGRFCMMYVAQENPAGIKMAFSDKINGGYIYRPGQVDFAPRSCEAPNVWKRIGEDKWVLMYDIFSIRPHNFGFAETSDFETFTNLGHFDGGVMQRTNFSVQKHGAVIQLTKEEVARLTEYYKQKPAYLFSYFTGSSADGLHLAYSYDGLTWTPLNGGHSFLKPSVGKDQLMRDPSILQAPDGVFHMVWTSSWTDRIIGYASSTDLIHWSEQQAIPVMMHEETAHNCWAPELFYDESSKTFYIFWATTIPGRHKEVSTSESEKGLNHRIYYVTTKDFRTFSETAMFFNPDFSVIDAAIVKIPSTRELLMIVKNENSNPPEKNLRVTRTTNIEKGFPVNVSAPITGNYWAEGPAPLFVGDTLYVYFDKYRDHRYGAVRSFDFGKTWEDVSELVSFPKGIRHGTAFPVKAPVVEQLINMKHNVVSYMRM